ncbi:GTP pyrophosphokinase family protein [Paenibacillus sp.]|uniref:GTP pyrophosphokinase n=1 Tax=Paenibacillus sp. TaxID=58172 RepID=UPI002D64AD5D|nr:GTP pyrophosphokinase family protein [Paenibacillus sp.]HZG87252.1 GTP pyrophosphokinase family protein [Paenibacillus sp.]
MDGRDWGKFLVPYEQAVEELKVKLKSMRVEMKKREEYSPIEFVTGRVKRVSSILEKAKRLNVPMEKLEEGIEDIAGIRIMCQFVADIEQMADLIRARKDMKVLYEKDYIRNNKPSGYRSYHIIVEYPVQTALGMKVILAEIQLRTLAMNFWATIEHSLSYKFQGNLPEHIRDRLSKAAEAAFRLDEEMSQIRSEIVEAQKLFENQSALISQVLNDIQQLYFYNRAKEAQQFQNRFSELWGGKDDPWSLRELSEQIQAALLLARKEHMS